MFFSKTPRTVAAILASFTDTINELDQVAQAKRDESLQLMVDADLLKQKSEAATEEATKADKAAANIRALLG